MNSHSRSRWRGSREAEGSSRSSTAGLAQKPDRDVDPLLVAAGELADLLVGPVREPGLSEHARDGSSGSSTPLQPGEQAQVLGHRELRVQRRLLRDPADLAIVRP